MRIALVDYENNRNLQEVLKEKPDEMVVFTSKKATLEAIPSIYECKVVNCLNGEKDAMDIQLSYYLGLHCKKDNEYIIYSSDKGYDSMINFARDRGFNVRRQKIQEEKQNVKKGALNELEKIEKDIVSNKVPRKVSHPSIWQLSRIISIVANKDIEKIYSFLSSCRKNLANDKERANKLFCKHLGTDCASFLMENFEMLVPLLSGK